MTALNTGDEVVGTENVPVQETERPTPRWFWPIVVALVVLNGIASWYVRSPGIVTGGDDAVYIQLSREVQQLSYRDQFLNGAPGHVKFPPGYPAYLAGISAVAGENVDAFLLGGIAATMCGLLLLADSVRRRVSPIAGLLVIIATFLNPRMIQYSGMVMSEALFFLCVSGTVWAFSHDRLRRSHILMGGAAAIASALTRSAGVTIVIAVVVVLLFARRMRAAIMVAAAGLVLNGAWFMWTTRAPEQIAGTQGENYVADTFIRPHTTMPSLPVTVSRRIISNARRYATRTVPSLLPLPHVAGTLVDNLFFVGVMGVCFIAGAWHLRRSWTIVPVVVATYVMLLLVWTWVVSRFMSPMIPFVLVLVITGALALVRRFRSPWRILIPASLAATVMLTGAASLQGSVRDVSTCDREEPLVSSGCIRPEQRDFLVLAEWVADSVSEHAVFLVHKEGTFGYLTGRRTIPLLTIMRADSTRVLDLLHDMGVTHVALTTLDHGSIRIAEQLLPACRSLELVQELSPTLLVFRVQPGPASDETTWPASCEALERYRQIMIASGGSSG
jgi:hypothetical protein